MNYIPVVDKEGKPLMPMHPARARKLVKSGEATSFWNRGIWCIRLNREPSARYKQDIAVGIDTGSHKEGYTIKSESHTYLNIQADAHRETGLHRKKTKNGKYIECDGKLQVRSRLRRSRRYRNCRNRQCRLNRLANKERIPAGTRCKWHWKLRILDFLKEIYPVNGCVVEDIRAKTLKGARKWNQSFSPLEVGKKWFYKEIRKKVRYFDTFQGYDTKEMRDRLGLKKSSNKMSSDFTAHCADSFVLANEMVNGDIVDNTKVLCTEPIVFNKRNLFEERFLKGGIRKRYGGTMCLGLKKGTLVNHIKLGLSIICGYSKKPTKKEPYRELITIRPIDASRRYQGIKKEDFKVLKRLSFILI